MEQEKIELTIITVCYNSENTINNTIESIVSQLNDDTEYLIIDGQSNDGTMDVIRDAQKKWPIRVVSEPDEGIYDAMNKGMRLARGRWLLYINSDDRLKADVLVKMLPILKADKVNDCICTDVEMRRRVHGEWYFRIWAAEKADHRIHMDLPFCHQGMYIRKEAMDEEKGFHCNFRIAADWDLVLRMYRSGRKFHILHVVNAEFLEGGASNKRMVWEKHQIRISNKSYLWIIPGLAVDLKNRLRSELGKWLLGDKKDRIVVEKNYTKVG